MKTNKIAIYLLSILAGLILLTVIYLGYKVVTTSNDEPSEKISEQNDSKNDDDDSTSTETEDETPQEETNTPEEKTETRTIPEGWIDQESEDYEYKIAVPNGWYYRFFSGTQSIGLDPNPIPEASEYPGVICFSALTESITEIRTTYTSDIQNINETSTTVNDKTWTQITGNTSTEDIFFPNYKVLHSLYESSGKTYKLTLMAEEETYNQTLETYQKVLESVELN